MWSSNTFLRKCEQLNTSYPAYELPAGQRIGRGFADLGYEEFLLIPVDKMVSLFTGQVSAFTQEQKTFFFPIPSVDQMVDLIQRANLNIEKLEYIEQRHWKLSIRSISDGVEHVLQAGTIEDVLVDALLLLPMINEKLPRTC